MGSISYLYGGNSLVQLQIDMQKITINNRIPGKLRRAIMSFFKKRDKKDLNNYSGINLLNTTFKLTTRLITTKMKERIILQEKQVQVWESLYRCGIYKTDYRNVLGVQ